MAKEKRTTLRPWQKQISKEQYQELVADGPIFGVNFHQGSGKFYQTDMENAEYKKVAAAKAAKRKNTIKMSKDIYAQRIENQRRYAITDAIKAGEVTIKTKGGDVKYIVMKETSHERKTKSAINAALREAKPKVSVEKQLENIAKREKEMAERKKKLMAKVSGKTVKTGKRSGEEEKEE